MNMTIEQLGGRVQNLGKAAAYGPGPWLDEQLDKAQWIDKETDLDCLIVRGPVGALCGYVGLPPEHPWHGKNYGECLDPDCSEEFCYEHSPEARVEVHGGITFSAACDEQHPEGICHVPEPGRPGDVWWFGFDCAHYQDTCPGVLGTLRESGTYKNVAYVAGQCAWLAQQLAAVAR